jgi:hypothetical protein
MRRSSTTKVQMVIDTMKKVGPALSNFPGCGSILQSCRRSRSCSDS